MHAATTSFLDPRSPPRLAFIVPAHDEAALIGATIDALHEAARGALAGAPYELVVVDDASTDDTADIARRHGAKVVRCERRQISAVRNAGISQTTAPHLMFVDADTIVDGTVVREALAILDEGAAGGGALARFDLGAPLGARLLLELVVALFRLLQYAGGCCFFCRRDALLAAGGWDERYFAGEEVELACALKRVGRAAGLPLRRRFRLTRMRVVTSGRKFRERSTGSICWLLLKLMCRGRRGLRSRRGLEFWYERGESP